MPGNRTRSRIPAALRAAAHRAGHCAASSLCDAQRRPERTDAHQHCPAPPPRHQRLFGKTKEPAAPHRASTRPAPRPRECDPSHQTVERHSEAARRRGWVPRQSRGARFMNAPGAMDHLHSSIAYTTSSPPKASPRAVGWIDDRRLDGEGGLHDSVERRHVRDKDREPSRRPARRGSSGLMRSPEHEPSGGQVFMCAR